MHPSGTRSAAIGAALVLVATVVVVGGEPTMGGEVIERRAHAWARSLDAGNLDAFIGRYERGGTFLPPGGHAVVGRRAIGEQWRSILGRFDLIFEFEPERMDADGRVGFVYGTYMISGHDPVEGEVFSIEDDFLQIWRRQRDGSWLIALDMWHPSSSGPPLLPEPDGRTDRWR